MNNYRYAEASLVIKPNGEYATNREVNGETGFGADWPKVFDGFDDAAEYASSQGPADEGWMVHDVEATLFVLLDRLRHLEQLNLC